MTRPFALIFSVILHALLIVLAVYGLPFFAKDREISTRLVVVEVMTIAELTNAPPPSETATPSEMPAETASAPDVPDRPTPPPPPPPPSKRPEPPTPAKPTPSVSTPPAPAEQAPPPPPEIAQPQTPPPAATPPEAVASAPPPEVAPATEAAPVPLPKPLPAETPRPEVVEPEPAAAPQPEVATPQPVEPEVAEAQPVDAPPVPTLRPTPPPRRQVAQAPEPPKKKEPDDPFASILNTVANFEKKPRPTEAEPNQQQAAANTQRQLAPSNADRPLSVSELDAIRQQISGCWLVPAGAKNAEDLIVEIRVRMRPDRTVSNTEILDSARMSEPHFRAAAEAAIRALRNPRCSPLNLPVDKYETWKSFVITFNPRDMLS